MTSLSFVLCLASSSCTLLLFASLSFNDNTTSYSHFAWLQRWHILCMPQRSHSTPHSKSTATASAHTTNTSLCHSECFFMLLTTRLLSEPVTSPNDESLPTSHEGRRLLGHPIRRWESEAHRSYVTCWGSQKVCYRARNWNHIFSIPV